MPDLTSAVTPCWGVPATLLSAVSATGTDGSQWFATQNTRVVNYFFSGTASACTVDVERSTDGGTTWVAMIGQTAIDVYAAPNGTFDCPTGAVYRLKVAGIEDGNATIIGAVDQ